MFGHKFFPSPPLTEPSSPHYPTPPPYPTCTQLINSYHLHMLPVLYMWFLKARCGQRFNSINHNHNQSSYLDELIHIAMTNGYRRIRSTTICPLYTKSISGIVHDKIPKRRNHQFVVNMNNQYSNSMSHYLCVISGC